MEDNKLFSEFPPVSTEKWEEVIHKDLKGADYDKKLVWKTIEGFNVKPYYRAEDLEGLEYLDSNPAQAPYTRGKHADNNVWDIRQDIKADSIEELNALAVDAVKRGKKDGFSLSQTSKELGLNRRTVSKYWNKTLDEIQPIKRHRESQLGAIASEIENLYRTHRNCEVVVQELKLKGITPLTSSSSKIY